MSDPIEALWHPNMERPLESEDDCLSIINLLFPTHTRHNPKGRGDDCAELEVSGNIVLSTDFFWQDTHFRTRYFTPREVGAKALLSAVSDIAACGAKPEGFSLGLMLPDMCGAVVLEQILSGMAAVAGELDLSLTGGDISRSDKLGFCITVWGKSIEPEKNFFLRRKQAQPGDVIFVIGKLGIARAGLIVLESLARHAVDIWPELCMGHLSSPLLVQEGMQLARIALDNPEFRISLMDVSDGVAKDLPRLLGDYGALLSIHENMIHPALLKFAKANGVDAKRLYLAGGEDYALMGTCTPEGWKTINQSLHSSVLLGKVQQNSAILCNDVPLDIKGFDHFSRTKSLLPSRQAVQDTPPYFVEQGKASVVSSTKVSEGQDQEGMDSLLETWEYADVPQRLKPSAILHCCSEAWRAGLLSGFNGNVSCRIPFTVSSVEGFCITGTCVAKAAVSMEDLAIVGYDNTLHFGATPSSESGMHAAVYKNCPKTAAILHTHPPRLLALSLLLPLKSQLDIPLVEAGIYRKKLGYVPSYPAGSPQLAKAVGEASVKYPAIWMENHGLIVHGDNLVYALALTEELEQIATIRLDSLR